MAHRDRLSSGPLHANAMQGARRTQSKREADKEPTPSYSHRILELAGFFVEGEP